MSKEDLECYEIISKFYSDRTAKRSGVRLMNHIDEGLVILWSLQLKTGSYGGWCLHPIVQNNEKIEIPIRLREADIAATIYSHKANAYLCRKENDWIKTVKDLRVLLGHIPDTIKMYLIADKLQNRKDFELYHKGTHERSYELTKYFDLWLEYLR